MAKLTPEEQKALFLTKSKAAPEAESGLDLRLILKLAVPILFALAILSAFFF